MTNKTIQLIISVLFLTSFISCKKQDDWLNAKRNKADVAPSTLQDYQALLDNDNFLNRSTYTLGMVGVDNYYVTYNNWQSDISIERNAYTWQSDIFQGQS